MADPVVAREALDRALDLARSHNVPVGSSFLDRYDFKRVDPEEYDNLPPAPPPKHYAGPAPKTVWPSEAFYDRMGFMPSTIKRYGEAQSALLSALDALGFGVPSATLSRVAPEAEASMSQIKKAHGNASTAGALSAALLNPLNSIFRAPGNALASRGWGIMPQAGADAATVAGVSMVPEVIRHGQPGLNTSIAMQAAPAVAMSRVFMPRLPDSIIERAWKGAAAGVTSGFPALGYGEVTPALLGGAVGAINAAGQRPSLRDAGSKLTSSERNRIEKTVDLAGLLSTVIGAPYLGHVGYTAGANDGPYDPDDPIVAYKIAASRPDPKLPRQRPSFPHETEYEEPRYSRFTSALPALD